MGRPRKAIYLGHPILHFALSSSFTHISLYFTKHAKLQLLRASSTRLHTIQAYCLRNVSPSLQKYLRPDVSSFSVRLASLGFSQLPHVAPKILTNPHWIIITRDALFSSFPVWMPTISWHELRRYAAGSDLSLELYEGPCAMALLGEINHTNWHPILPFNCFSLPWQKIICDSSWISTESTVLHSIANACTVHEQTVSGLALLVRRAYATCLVGYYCSRENGA